MPFGLTCNVPKAPTWSACGTTVVPAGSPRVPLPVSSGLFGLLPVGRAASSTVTAPVKAGGATLLTVMFNVVVDRSPSLSLMV